MKLYRGTTTIIFHYISSALAITIWKGQTSYCKTCFWIGTASQLHPGNAPHLRRLASSCSLSILCSLLSDTKALMTSSYCCNNSSSDVEWICSYNSLTALHCLQTRWKEKKWEQFYVDGWSQLSRHRHSDKKKSKTV